MTQRKDMYRAALQREQDVAEPRSAKVTTLHTRYLRVTIEVDPDLRRDLSRWVNLPVSALVLVGATVLRSLTDAASGVSGR
ncbi:hypothetical protein HUT19_35060 [Streptomyces sp. NA02950]|uniref:hypothetical protein n=1 Tax=Streptomyces sp. NA02950 TaxID=2742137 RepID=UPI0015900E53|nr:hypothetical protein [Streptomyces sp. NA02950]QKV96294.1 hypothetical protein HUT19_35060 [Streptomyces sp. NA02950]